MATIPIPVILGPTATGKTSVGIELARLLNGEIISVDSRKVYRGLPIGTATPKGEWTGDSYVVKGIAHHLMSFLKPDQFYTAGDFAKDAERLMNGILNRGKRPILVGGTGFYLNALLKGLPELPERDENMRLQLEERSAKEGSAALHAELVELDPEAAQGLDPNDRQKIIRALEVCLITNEPFSKWKRTPRKASARPLVIMGLEMDKGLLEKRIETRSRFMEQGGMIDETEAIIKEGFPTACPALTSFGYKEAVQVIQGTLPRSQFLPLLIKGTKAYAKRQRTWFRTQVRPLWFPCDETTESASIAMKMKAFLENPII